MPLTCIMAGALGLTFGTRFEPRTVPILFGVIVLPAHVPRGDLLLVGGARADPVAPDRWSCVNPLVYMSEGFRAALTPADHMSLWAIYRRAHRLHRALHATSGSPGSSKRVLS